MRRDACFSFPRVVDRSGFGESAYAEATAAACVRTGHRKSDRDESDRRLVDEDGGGDDDKYYNNLQGVVSQGWANKRFFKFKLRY